MKGLIANFNEVVILPKDDNGRFICRIVNTLIDGKRENQDEKFFRNEAVTIINESNGMKVVRFSVGNGSVTYGNDKTSLARNQIGLDYNARDKLGVTQRDTMRNVNILVRRANMFERFMFFWNHENRADRFAMRGLVLGEVSFLLGILSVVLAI